jgi:hypothetical protein
LKPILPRLPAVDLIENGKEQVQSDLAWLFWSLTRQKVDRIQLLGFCKLVTTIWATCKASSSESPRLILLILAIAEQSTRWLVDLF